MERERQAWGEARADLQKQAEGTEKRCEALHNFSQGLTEQHRDMERRYQQVFLAPG